MEFLRKKVVHKYSASSSIIKKVPQAKCIVLQHIMQNLSTGRVEKQKGGPLHTSTMCIEELRSSLPENHDPLDTSGHGKHVRKS